MKLDSVDVGTLATVLGLTRRQVQRLAKDGVIPRLARGRYDLPASVQSWAAHLAQGKSIKALVSGRQRLITAQAVRAELENKKAEGTVVDLEELRTCLFAVMQTLAYELSGVSSRVAAEVAGETDPSVIQEILSEEHRRIRTSAADALSDLADKRMAG